MTRPSDRAIALGRIAYEAAASVTGCTQPWDGANQAKWIAAASAVAVAPEAAREPIGFANVHQLARDAAPGSSGRDGFMALRKKDEFFDVPLYTAPPSLGGEDRKDAERHRFMCSPENLNNPHVINAIVSKLVEAGGSVTSKETWDQATDIAIDAARAAGGDFNA